MNRRIHKVIKDYLYMNKLSQNDWNKELGWTKNEASRFLRGKPLTGDRYLVDVLRWLLEEVDDDGDSE